MLALTTVSIAHGATRDTQVGPFPQWVVWLIPEIHVMPHNAQAL